MERRKFLLSLCATGAAAAALTPVAHARARRSIIANNTNSTVYLKIVGPFPGLESCPPRGGILFPEEEYNDDLGEGKRVAILWDHTGEKVLLTKEITVVTPCRIDVEEDNVRVSYEL